MKGDFTRFTFDPTAHYTQVRKQQGRVDLDADWNEYLDIQSYLSETTHTDVIGACGAPEEGGGFKAEGVLPDGSDLNLSAGRIYVDGILCEAESPITYLTQPDDPSPPALSPADGRRDLILLDVWKRHLTALEAPPIREVALGGPDTTTRVQTVWQVKVLEGVGDWDCGDPLPEHPLVIPPLDDRGRLTSFVDPATPPEDVCDVPTAGGYRGLENRLYRVEIHQTGDINSATFKWSRDNGAVVFAIEAFDGGDPTKIQVKSLGRDQVLGLRIGDWVEVLGDTSELHGTPGTLAKITDLDEAKRELTLSVDVSAHSGEDHPKVRRWDQESDALPVSTSELELEDGVKVQFADGAFQTGDYWVFAARTATADVEHLTDSAPFGIVHHYCGLAVLAWRQEAGEDEEVIWEADLTDCRPLFPALTNLPEACDIRFHNKHLHGWGIVCGLQVHCGQDGGETRRNVTVRDGYAIDCEGYDLIVDENIIVDVLTEIEILTEETGVSILDESGNGEVFLTLERTNNAVGVKVEPYDPAVTSLSGMLQNTLLMDFFNDCIKEPLEAIQQLITPPPGENDLLVSPARERFITLVNLIIQLLNPTDGRYVFLSPKEDQILRELYFLVRGMLQSKTFCAMFEDARDFPDYPFPEHQISTIFGKAYYKRLRLHPNEVVGFTTGLDNAIHVFDLEKEQMIGVIEVPGGEGIVVQDVAVSPDGKFLYAVATTANGENTIFAVGALENFAKPAWQPVVVLCDMQLVTLAVTAARPELVYAVGKGQGLYELAPSTLADDPNPTPIFPFNATGHLVLLDQNEKPIAYAGANLAGGSSDLYDRIVACDLLSPSVAPPFFLLKGPGGESLNGQDDIAAVQMEKADGTILVAVVNDPKGGKALLEFLANADASGTMIPVENTDIRLGHFPGSPYLMVSFEDSYQIVLLDLLEQTLVEGYRFPVQISPLGFATALKPDKVYVVNVLSTTLSAIPAVDLDPSRPPLEVEPIPGGQEFLDLLEAYRNAIFAAFIDLLGGLLQYLKDCFCDHFLVNCPECTGEEKIYLVVVSVRNNEVYKVCNFSGRKYVKSFPTLEYWLSVVPVIPVIDKAMEMICCAVLPDLFRKYTAPQAGAYQTAVKGSDMRGGMSYVQTTNFSNLFAKSTSQVKMAGGLSLDVLSNFARQTVTAPAPTKKTGGLQQTEVAGKPVASAEKQLKTAGVEVVGRKAYEPGNAGNLVNFARSASAVPAGAKVILHEQAGVVKYYEVVKETLVESAVVPTFSPEKLAAMEAELAELRAFREEVRAFMKRSKG